MKKLFTSILTASLFLAIATATFAQDNEVENGVMNFGQMKPFMEEMHPELSEKELKDMYESCHGTNGAMPSKNFQHMNHMDMGL
ncbi:hypothetical protein ACFYKX_03350 [Cytobacillus sp. FJAT-54145]|uniref:FAD/FMN-containing dehydrogenase n=1 Tax=Cytobacillus spartinae TaxID=3299023 RepID=A0ABW6K639_9BACI